MKNIDSLQDTYDFILSVYEKHISWLEKCVKDSDYKNFPWWKKIIAFTAEPIYDEYYLFWVKTLRETKAQYEADKIKYRKNIEELK